MRDLYSKFFFRLLFAFYVLFVVTAHAKTVFYELKVTNISVNLSGKKNVDFALAVNGTIPAPVLEFTEGDDAELLVKNGTNEEVSIHWHGILLPPAEDGVAYVNTPPIFAGQSRLFKFKIRQNGTYWYHSHTMLQEQKGVYGAIVIHPKKEQIRANRESVLVLSDWSDENADQILKNLRKDGDYYLHKKNSVRSYFGAIQARSLGSHLHNEWIRMGGMDLSDVGYDAFLINGIRNGPISYLKGGQISKPGETIRLRIVNAGASSYFYVTTAFPKNSVKVISADGVDIRPVTAQKILMGMAETIDLLITLPEKPGCYEIRATAQDVTGYASNWIESGTRNCEGKFSAPEIPVPDLYATMDHSAHAGHDMDHSVHTGHAAEHSSEIRNVDTLTVDSIEANQVTQFPHSEKRKAPLELKLVLGGDMERYVWHINGKAIHEERDISVQEGEVVRFTFVNETMMHHPMHLHGHFFRVINSFGDRSPLKHTVDVPPHGTRTIEFLANEPGRWMLHCHNLYHMKTGMARVISYTGFVPSAEVQKHEHHDPHMHEHLYPYGKLQVASNIIQAQGKIMRTWDALFLRLESRNPSHRFLEMKRKPDGDRWDLEGDLFYKRYIGNFYNLNIGPHLFDKKLYAAVGANALLPLLIEAEGMVTHNGKILLGLEKKFQWTKNIFSETEITWRPNWDADHKFEYLITLMYSPQWAWSAGLTFTNESLGIGGSLQF